MVEILKSMNSHSSNVLEMAEYILVPKEANNLTKKKEKRKKTISNILK